MSTIALLPLFAPFRRCTLGLPAAVGRVAADILVDREGAIAYKQLGWRLGDPAMTPACDVEKCPDQGRELSVHAGPRRWQC